MLVLKHYKGLTSAKVIVLESSIYSYPCFLLGTSFCCGVQLSQMLTEMQGCGAAHSVMASLPEAQCSMLDELVKGSQWKLNHTGEWITRYVHVFMHLSICIVHGVTHTVDGKSIIITIQVAKMVLVLVFLPHPY